MRFYIKENWHTDFGRWLVSFPSVALWVSLSAEAHGNLAVSDFATLPVSLSVFCGDMVQLADVKQVTNDEY
jgi:hypothetical protein